MPYKFRKKHRDPDVARIQEEIEDNLARLKDVEIKDETVKEIVTTAPTLATMKKGERKIYDDGTNIWYYRRAGNRLFKMQWTEVT